MYLGPQLQAVDDADVIML